MRIKEFHIIRYGPLSFKSPITPGPFSVIFGKNEEGKSLTIDALVKLLFGRKLTEFSRIDRVAHLPEGYVLIERQGGDSQKLPESGFLTDVTGLTQRECSNIFIIRNSNLSISKQDDFFTDITDRLTGLKTAEIARIKTALFEMARLTPGETFRDIKGEKLKTRLDRASSLIEQIEALIEEMKSSGFDELYEKKVLLDEHIAGLSFNLENLEDARRRELFEKCSGALDTIEVNELRLAELAAFTEKDEQEWRNCENSIAHLEKERADTTRMIGEKESVLMDVSEKFEDKRRSQQILDEKREIINNEIRPRIRYMKARSAEIAAQASKSRFTTALFAAVAALTGLSLMGAVFTREAYFFYICVFFLFGFITVSAFKLILLRKKGKLDSELREVNMLLSTYGMNAGNLELVLENVQKFEDNCTFLSNEVNELLGEVNGLKGTIQALKTQRLQTIESSIMAEKDRIRKIQESNGLTTLGQFTDKLRQNKKLHAEIQERQALLRELLGEESDSKRDAHTRYWKSRVEGLRQYREKAEGVTFNEEELLRVKDELNRKNEEREKYDDEIVQCRRKLEEVEREVNSVLDQGGEHLPCATTVDLEAVKKLLAEFIDAWETIRENVLAVLNLFEQIEQEEKEKVQGLFGPASSVTGYFKDITGGRYTQVLYNREAASIDVRRENGEVLSAEKLSSGAYDQLYLSVRLALGSSLLKDNRGFFIFDDPFIKADPDRLERQFRTLVGIAERGWQVLFFSAKGEIEELVERMNRKKRIIEFIELRKNLS